MYKYTRTSGMLALLLVAGSCQQTVAAASNKSLEMAALIARLVGSATLAAGGAIAFNEASPKVSKLTIGAALTTCVVLATRLICGRDINKTGYTIPLIDATLPPEFNWFNGLVGVGAAAIFGVYYHGSALLEAFNRLGQQS